VRSKPPTAATTGREAALFLTGGQEVFYALYQYDDVIYIASWIRVQLFLLKSVSNRIFDF
jgi:hypothetical protein